MPEGPEIHIAARFINNTAKHHRFGGSIDKSEVSTKNPTVEWSAKEYNIRAEARGKELKIHVVDAKDKTSKTHLLLRFGMSGCFKLSDADDMPKHAHLRFYTINSKKKQVRSAVKTKTSLFDSLLFFFIEFYIFSIYFHCYYLHIFVILLFFNWLVWAWDLHFIWDDIV